MKRPMVAFSYPAVACYPVAVYARARLEARESPPAPTADSSSAQVPESDDSIELELATTRRIALMPRRYNAVGATRSREAFRSWAS